MKYGKDNLIVRVILITSMAFCGVVIALGTDEVGLLTNKPSGTFIAVALMLFAVAVSFFLQSTIHELGHLVCGLISGYKFTSFRIGKLMIIKENGKIKGKIFNIVGTGGQCLMMPPLWSDNFPYKLYNFGGCIANIFAAIVFIAISTLTENGYLFSFATVMATVGIMMALVNGIPLRPSGVANDGFNAFVLGKNKKAVRAFWLQLYVNGLIAAGERMHNLPEDWFFLPEGEDLENPVICSVGIFRYNYYFDAHDFAKAEETAEHMIKAPGLLGLHKNELMCELLFCRIIRKAEPDEIDSLLTPELNKYIKATASYVSRKRLSFAYFYLYKKQYDIAFKCQQAFESVCRTYPYSSEIENEKEIMEMLQGIDPDAPDWKL